MESHLLGSHYGGPHMIGEVAAYGHHTVTALLHRICQEKLELPDLQQTTNGAELTCCTKQSYVMSTAE